MWVFKTYYLFPVIVKLRHLDHISRFAFPTAYLIYFLYHFSEVDFGRTQQALLHSAQGNCYRD